MEFENKHIRDHIRNQQTDVPPDFSWDNMKEGILDTMHQAPLPNRKRRLMLWLWAILLSSGALGGYLYYRFTPISTPTKAAEQPVFAGTNQPKYSNDTTIGTTNVTNNGNTTTRENQAAEVENFALFPIAKTATPNSENSKDAPTQNVKPTRQPLNQQMATNSNTPNFETSQSMDVQQDLENKTSSGMNTAQAQIQEYQQGIQQENSATYTEITKIASVIAPIELAIAPLLDVQPLLPTVFEHSLKVKIPHKMSPLQIGGSLGIGYAFLPTTPKYALPTNVTVSETGLASLFAEMYVHKGLNKAFYTQAGIEWQQVNSQFNYTSSKPTQVLLTNVVMLKRVNVVTRDTAFILGDTTVNAVETRTVQHFNQSNAWNIPLRVGYQKTVGRWGIGIEVGTAFNVNTKYSGRTYDSSGQVVNIVSDGSYFKKSTGFSLSSGGLVTYRLTQHLSIGGQIAVSKFLSNRSTEVGVTNKPFMLRTGLQIKYSF